ncbi:MAG: ABC transporter permease, partial [Chloroflexi bacterium]
MSERRYISSQQRIWLTFRRNKTAVGGAFLALVVVILAVLAPWISPCDPLEQNVYYRLKGPEPAHPMGVDDFGRDVLSRVLWGARTSLVVGVTSVLVGLVLGTVMGIVAGFKGGRLEYVIMRAVDVLLSFPTLVMGLMVMAILGSGIVKLILAIGVVMSPRFARVAHGPTLSLREQEFVLAARSLGASDVRILCRHIFPNVLGELLVMASLWTATAIRIEANLSFIGLG